MDTNGCTLFSADIEGRVPYNSTACNSAFEMLNMGAISAEDFVQNEYCIEDTEKAIVEHA